MSPRETNGLFLGGKNHPLIRWPNHWSYLSNLDIQVELGTSVASYFCFGCMLWKNKNVNILQCAGINSKLAKKNPGGLCSSCLEIHLFLLRGGNLPHFTSDQSRGHLLQLGGWNNTPSYRNSKTSWWFQPIWKILVKLLQYPPQQRSGPSLHNQPPSENWVAKVKHHRKKGDRKKEV